MNIRIKGTYTSSEIITSVEDYVEISLDGESYDRGGRMETIGQTANNCIEALARLCDVLSEKDIISLLDVVYIAKGHRDYDKLEAIE